MLPRDGLKRGHATRGVPETSLFLGFKLKFFLKKRHQKLTTSGKQVVWQWAFTGYTTTAPSTAQTLCSEQV